MSTDPETTAVVRSWLHDGPQASADRVLEAVVGALDATPQRRDTPLPTATSLVAIAAVVAVFVLGIAALVATDVGGPTPAPRADVALPINNLDAVPTQVPLPAGMPDGPAVQVVRAEARAMWFTVTLAPAREWDGVCVGLTTAQESSAGCGPAPGEGLPQFGRFGGIGEGELPNGMFQIHGTVASDVASVWVVTREGQRATATLVPFTLGEVEGSVFFIFLPADIRPETMVAADASGAVLTEIPMISTDSHVGPDGTPGAPSPLPTPDG
jgi:hypothetical protein